MYLRPSKPVLRILLDKHRADFKFSIYMARKHTMYPFKLYWLKEAAYHRRQIGDIKRLLEQD